MKTTEFDFVLPKEQIAKKPLSKRELAKLMVIDRNTKHRAHRNIGDLPDILNENDVLVFNRSRVIPARILLSEKEEVFLCHKITPKKWACMIRTGKAFPVGRILSFSDGSHAEVEKIRDDGLREISFFSKESFSTFLEKYGSIPLPPYLERQATQEDKNDYQTVFADHDGSVAAPTAGLHFTKSLLELLQKKKVQMEWVTLHVGLGTFLPVKTEEIKDHQMHAEYAEISVETAESLARAKKSGKRIIAVGSTSLRTLESSVRKNGAMMPFQDFTKLFLFPPADFCFVDGFFTNFHLPKSTLLMLVSAFMSPKKMEGKDILLAAYQEAIQKNYRFFSYGDAMLIL